MTERVEYVWHTWANEQRVHIYPLYGRKHVLEGVECWCQPTRDSKEPWVIVHRPEQ